VLPFLSLKLLHVGLAMIWMGGGVFFPREVRRAVELGRPHTTELRGRINHVTRVLVSCALLTVLTGVGLVLLSGGFSAAPLRIRIAIGATALAFVTGGGFVEPTLRKLWAAIDRDDAQEQRRLARRFSMGVGIEHLFRGVVLFLMVIPL
jgi:hypothetical protein